jgi:hypothetical protein
MEISTLEEHRYHFSIEVRGVRCWPRILSHLNSCESTAGCGLANLVE